MNLKLNDYFKKASREKWAMAHFNVSSLEQIKAVILAAQELNSPVMLGVSDGEREYLGIRQIVALTKSFREETGLPIFLNADHSKSIESAKKAIDAGFDSIHIDLSKLPFEENIKGTKEIVEYAKSKNPDISVEGELGHLRGESRIQKEIIEIKEEDLTEPEKALEFIEKTGIDRFAPVVGNIHGISANDLKLDIERIKTLRKILPENVALVLHGGSGIPDEQIKKAIEAGISNIHINTEIRVIYAETLRKVLNENLEETTPYKILPPVIEEMKNKIKEKIKLFGSENKI